VGEVQPDERFCGVVLEHDALGDQVPLALGSRVGIRLASELEATPMLVGVEQSVDGIALDPRSSSSSCRCSRIRCGEPR
jgi:hypothetical protein